MKSYQVQFDNKKNFVRFLDSIKRDNDISLGDNVSFYFSWKDSSKKFLNDVTSSIENFFPNALYYGNEASGNIINGDLAYGISITCCIFEDSSTKLKLVWVEKETELSSLNDLWSFCANEKGLKAVELIPSISYLDALKMDGNIPELDDDVLIFGGASVNYDNPTFEADIIAKGHELTRSGMAVMLYYGKNFNVVSDYVLGWKGFGKSMTVTNSHDRVIEEIDEIPAFSVYEKYLNLNTSDNDNLVFPLIVVEDGVEYIRTPQAFLSDKSMRMFANIPMGTSTRIAYGDKNTILSTLYDEVKEIYKFNPQFIKAYSCAARRLFWGDGEINRETLPLQEIAPVCGFYTGGEILRFGEKLRVLNSTLVIISMREGNEGEHKEFSSSFKEETDKSLVSRLSYFAETIVEEQREQTDKINEEMQMISVLAGGYHALYFVNLDDNTFTIYSKEGRHIKEMQQIMDGNTNGFSVFQRYGQSDLIHPADRHLFAELNTEVIRERLAHSKKFTTRFRRNYGGEYLWSEMDIMKYEDIDEQANEIAICFAQRDSEIREEMAQTEQMARRAAISDYFIQSYVTSYYYNLIDDKVLVLHSDFDKDKKLIGKTISFERSLLQYIHNDIHPDDRAKVLFFLDRNYIRSRLEKTYDMSFEFRDVSDNAPGDYRCYIIRGEDENHVGICFRNITEEAEKQREYENKLNNALLAANSANKSKTSFLFNMSHDIRTPMNAIKGFTAMAKKYADDTEKVSDYLNKIDISGQQLLSLINQVLEMSRIESGRIDLDLNPVDIREKFEAMATVISAQAQLKNIELIHEMKNIKHFNVLSDDTRMSQITLNIVGNALKYTPDGGTVVMVLEEIPCRNEGSAAFRFTVTDTGIGMTEEFLGRLFEPFSREKNTTTGNIQGTGLGLTIVKSLIDCLGGTIDVESEHGKGSKFVVTCTFRLADENDCYTYDDNDSGIYSFEGRRVLLVEDSEMNREIAKDILEDYGISVEEAEDGDIALEMVKKAWESGDFEYYDFILMDIQMPRMNGYDATRAIRKLDCPDNVHVPIIAVSANAFKEDAEMAIESGMDAHIPKPIDVKLLTETMHRLSK